MRFGGTSQFGKAQFGGDPYGFSPSHVCDRIIVSLSRFLVQPDGTGCVRTIKRLAGSLSNRQDVDRLLAGASPAFLVLYQGGAFKPAATTENLHNQTVQFTVIAIANNYRDQRTRLSGTNVYDPGVDNLARWATFYVGRELVATKSLNRVRPTELRYLDYLPGKYSAVVSFEAQVQLDLYDSDGDLSTLERLGIVHNPLSLDELFEGDNTTPNNDDHPFGYGEVTL